MKHKILFFLFGVMGLFAVSSGFKTEKDHDKGGGFNTNASGIEKAVDLPLAKPAASTVPIRAVSIAKDKAFAPPPIGGYLRFDYRKDTISNALKDTLFIGRRDNTIWNTVTTPTNFLSLYTYDISVVRASLSGTHNVKLYLDKSNDVDGTSTDWFPVDSTSTTTATTAMLRSTDATGGRYRLRISGTGTQSSTYQIWSIWKKKN